MLQHFVQMSVFLHNYNRSPIFSLDWIILCFLLPVTSFVCHFKLHASIVQRRKNKKPNNIIASLLTVTVLPPVGYCATQRSPKPCRRNAQNAHKNATATQAWADPPMSHLFLCAVIPRIVASECSLISASAPLGGCHWLREKPVRLSASKISLSFRRARDVRGKTPCFHLSESIFFCSNCSAWDAISTMDSSLRALPGTERMKRSEGSIWAPMSSCFASCRYELWLLIKPGLFYPGAF